MVSVDTTSTAVARTIQYRRRYLEVDASEMAPARNARQYGPHVKHERTLTNERLGNQTADWSREPYEARELLSKTEIEEEWCAVSSRPRVWSRFHSPLTYCAQDSP